MIRAAVIGVSGFGDHHYKDLLRQAERGRMAIAAATVINPDEEKEKCARLREAGCELFTDYREMLKKHAGRLELCFIPTGIPLHAPMTIAALRAGANVYVEKPAAGTVQEVRAMEAASREAGRFVAVGYQTMYMAETLPMKRALLDGRIGRVRSVKYWACWPRMDNYYARNNWAGRLKVGESWVLDSPFNNAVAHQANMVCFLAGTTLETSAKLASVRAELYRARAIESPDTAAILATAETGVRIGVFLTHVSEAGDGPVIEAIGDAGRLQWTPKEWTLEPKDGPAETAPSADGYSVDGREAIMDALRARVADGKAFVCTLDIAGTQTLLANAAHESSAIHPIDAAFIERRPEKDTMKVVVRGMDEAILRAFKEEKLFSEIGAPWAKPAEPSATVDVRNYPGFFGGRTGVK